MADTLLASDALLNLVASFNGKSSSRTRISKHMLKKFDAYAKGTSLELDNLRSVGSLVHWSSKLLKELHAKSLAHISCERALFLEHEKQIRLDPPVELKGNYNIWQVVKAIRGYKLTSRDKRVFSDYTKRFSSSVASYLSKSLDLTTPKERSTFLNEIEAYSEGFSKYQSLSDAIATRLKEASSQFERSYKKYKGGDSDAFRRILSEDRRRDESLSVISLGSINLIRICGVEVALTSTHSNRLVTMLRSFGNIYLGMRDIGLRNSPEDTFESLLESFDELVEEDVDFMGEALKGARGILIAELDKDKVFDISASQNYIKSMEPYRRRWSMYYRGILKSLCTTIPDSINLSNIFRSFPHPDANLNDVFESISGLKEPNRVDMEHIPRFTGTLRKLLCKSVHSQGEQIRLFTKTLDPSAMLLETDSRKSSPDPYGMFNASWRAWSKVKVEKVNGLVDPEKIKVKPSSKASQKKYIPDLNEINEGREWSSHSTMRKPSFLSEVGTLNDATEEIKGMHGLNIERALRRFKEVTRLHEIFEAKYPGRIPEDIPIREFEEFLVSTPSAQFIVGTEPKFGEIHKKVTRMFYMAEQELKVITQTIERYARQVSRRQPGVSITQSYEARRGDIESFSKTMTGGTGESPSLYLSFDMSEFSKKFPMSLMREYGKVLAELSGCKWLERIDLVFRSSMIIHNSRGFFNSINGVMGGFEGFFNFIWSSINATIMTIALEATGQPGNLLTFSDDGLLQMILTGSNSRDEVMAKVLIIQEIYLKFGLVFHIGKTLVSYNVWEYLGSVCNNSHILSMFMKELCSIGKISSTRGLEPLYGRIRSIEGQCEALCASGGSIVVAYILKRFYAGCILSRVLDNSRKILEEVLLILPSSAGGFRISSPSEMTYRANIEKDSEIAADLIGIGRSHPHILSGILNELRYRCRREGDVLSAVMSGTRLVTTHPDTSGMGVINEAIEIVIENHGKSAGLSKDPLSGPLGDALIKALPSVLNLDVSTISGLVYSTSEWTDYADSIALVKGSGAIRLISRDDLRKLQSADTKKCCESVEQWRGVLDDPGVTSHRIHDVMIHMEGLVFKGLNLSKMRPSPRIVLSRTKSDPCIVVNLSLGSGKSCNDLEFSEPVVRFASFQSSLAWFSESGVNSNTARSRRFLNSAARFLVESPESEHVISCLCAVLGFELPIIPPNIRRNLSRGNKDVDTRAVIPNFLDALSISRYTGSLFEYVKRMKSGDRTTYKIAAKCMSTMIFGITTPWSRRVDSLKETYNFSVDEKYFELMHTNPQMSSNPNYEFHISPGLVKFEDGLRQEFITSLIELSDRYKSISNVSSFSDLDKSISTNDSSMIKNMFINVISKFISSVIGRNKLSGSFSRGISIPFSIAREVVLSASVSAACRCLDPQKRRILTDLINRTLGKPLTDLVVKQVTEDESFSGFMVYLTFAIQILDPLEIRGYDPNHLRAMIHDGHQLVGELQNQIMAMDMMGDCSMVVVRGNLYPVGRFSPTHRLAFKEAFTATISALYSKLAASDWNKVLVATTLGVRMDTDDIMDCLFVARSLVRESDHRCGPYNKNSFLIEITKMYKCINESSLVIKHDQASEDLDKDINKFLDNFRLGNEDRTSIKDRIERQRKEPLGPDHTQLLRNGIPITIRNRVALHIRAWFRGRLYGSASKSSYLINWSDAVNLQTSFYENVIRKASKSVIELSAELERNVIERFSPSSRVESELVQFPGIPSCISMMNIDIGKLPSYAQGQVINLIGAHIEDFCMRNGVSGLHPERRNDEWINKCCESMRSYTGMSLGKWSKKTNADLKGIALRSTDASDALSTFIYLNVESSSSLSLLNIPENGIQTYFVVGITDHKFEEREPQRWGNIGLTDEQIDDIKTFIPSMSFSSRASHIRESIRKLASEAEPRNVESSWIMSTDSFLRSSGSSGEVNNSSPMLQAAIELARTANLSKGQCGFYAALILLSKGIEKVTGPKARQMGMGLHMRTQDQKKRVSTLRDMGEVYSWLCRVPIAHGMDVDHVLLSENIRYLSSLTLMYEIPKVLTGLKIRGMRDAMENLQGSEIGDIAQSLFQEQKILMIEWEPDGVMMEEGETIEDMQKFLDEMGF